MFYQKFNRHGKKRMFNRLLTIVIICFPNCKALKIKQVISNFDIGDDFFSFLVQFLSFYVKVLLSRLDFWEAFNYVECLRSLVLIVDRYFISGTLRENLQRFRSFSSSSLLLINKPSIHLSYNKELLFCTTGYHLLSWSSYVRYRLLKSD